MHRIPQILTGGSLLLLQAACPPQQPVTTDTTADPGSTTTSGGVTDGSSSSATTATSTGDAVGTTTGGTTMPATDSAADGATDGDVSEGPVDPGCTYPGSTSGEAASPEIDEACACLEGSGSCGMKLCATISGTCDSGGFDEQCHGSWKYADDALTCAITAAAAGTEGTIEWRFTPNGGFSEHTGFLHITSDRRAIRRDVEVLDLTRSVSDTELWNLEDPSWFEGCLELASFCERMDCFFAGTKGAALSLCEEGYDDYSYY